jgi:kinetochore protein Spc7/SPC105
VLETINAQAEHVLPALEREHELIQSELEAEQTEVSEIEQCDQNYLNDLMASIAEQKSVH